MRADQFNPAVFVFVAENLFDRVDGIHLFFFVLRLGLCADHHLAAAFADRLQVDVVKLNAGELFAHLFHVDLFLAFQFDQNAARKVDAVVEALENDTGDG